MLNVTSQLVSDFSYFEGENLREDPCFVAFTPRKETMAVKQITDKNTYCEKIITI